MTERQRKSFSQVAFVEAVARQARVYLVIRPIRPGSQSHLCSRFLGLDDHADLVLAAPETQTDQKKVFLPIGWDLAMSFRVGSFLLQAPTRVLGHCQHAQHATRRIDAILVQRPGKVTSLNRRREFRHPVDPSVRVAASVWLASELNAASRCGPRMGMLANRSTVGLGIRFDRKLPADIGSGVIVRLEDRSAESCVICQAVLKHCTPVPDGKWLAGFGDVVELAPGQAVPIMESLVLPRT